MLRNKKGYLLMECVVSSLLLGVFISCTLLALVSSKMASATAKHKYLATSLARETIEGALTTYGDPAALTTFVFSIDNIDYTATPQMYSGDEFLAVTVTWTEGLGAVFNGTETIAVRVPW